MSVNVTPSAVFEDSVHSNRVHSFDEIAGEDPPIIG